MSLEEVGKVLFEILAVGGGASAIAYGFFKLLGEKWLEAKFSERLEKLKHEQERELEMHRLQINSLFSRISKIHEKEFDVLPNAWNKLQEALGYVSRFTSPAQYYPNFFSMTQPEIAAFLLQSRLNEVDKKKVIDSLDRDQTYKEIIFWYDLKDVRTAVGEFHNYILINRIFLSKELFEKFGALDTMLTGAVSDREVAHVSQDVKLKLASYKIFGDDLTKLVNEVEKLVQERLHFVDAV